VLAGLIFIEAGILYTFQTQFIQYWLDSHSCRQVSQGETLQPIVESTAKDLDSEALAFRTRMHYIKPICNLDPNATLNLCVWGRRVDFYRDVFGAIWVCFLPAGASDGNSDSEDGRTPYFGTKTQRDWVNGSKAIKADSDTNSASYI
jgi:hypothetical protein